MDGLEQGLARARAAIIKAGRKHRRRNDAFVSIYRNPHAFHQLSFSPPFPSLYTIFSFLFLFLNLNRNSNLYISDLEESMISQMKLKKLIIKKNINLFFF